MSLILAAQVDAQQFTLEVNKGGTGTGTVTSKPRGIKCGTDCSQSYIQSTTVTLVPKAAKDSIFAGWSGDSDCADGVVTLDGNKSCVATFTTFGLNVGTDGTGAGTVTSKPSGIKCGSDCSQNYRPGTIVTLRAKAVKGSTFAGWSGGGCGGMGTCTASMNANTTVTATFNSASGVPTITSLSAATGRPGEPVTLTGSGFNPSAQVFVRFFDNQGFDAEVRVMNPTATSLRVGVPPYFNVQTSQFGASPTTVSLQVVQRVGSSTTGSNTIGGFQIGALPSSGGSTGSRTIQWIGRTIQETEEAIRRLDALSQLFPQATSHATLRSELSGQLTVLNDMRNEVTAISGGQINSVAFGQINGNFVQLDTAALSLIDQFIEALLQEVQADEDTASSVDLAPLQSIPFQFKPGADLTGAASIANFQAETNEEAFEQLFASLREDIRRNRDIMTRVGQGLMATGGLIAVVPGAQVPGLALAGLGALTWFVAVHAHTGILLSLDVGTSEALGGRTGYDNAIEDMRAYVTEVATTGAGYVAGVMNETVGTLLDLRTVGTELGNLTQAFVENTRQDYESVRIPPQGASDLPTAQSCCVIHGGCPGETGSQCALNCCCCDLGFACDVVNTINGCIFVGS